MARAPLALNVFWYALGGLMLTAVAILSLMPIEDIGVGDKLAHTVTYAVLSGYFSLLARNLVRLGLSALALVCFGACIELLQGMTGYRFAEWGDLLANGLGILAGIAVYPTPLRRVLELVDAGLVQLGKR